MNEKILLVTCCTYIWLLWSCQYNHTISESHQNTDTSNISEIKAYFNISHKRIESLSSSSIMPVGNFTPLWDYAQFYSNNTKQYVEVPIISDFSYLALKPSSRGVSKRPKQIKVKQSLLFTSFDCENNYKISLVSLLTEYPLSPSLKDYIVNNSRHHSLITTTSSKYTTIFHIKHSGEIESETINNNGNSRLLIEYLDNGHLLRRYKTITKGSEDDWEEWYDSAENEWNSEWEDICSDPWGLKADLEKANEEDLLPAYHDYEGSIDNLCLLFDIYHTPCGSYLTTLLVENNTDFNKRVTVRCPKCQEWVEIFY